MKYTRYDLKRSKDNRTFFAVIFLILVLAFMFGTIIFKLFMKNPISSGFGNTSQVSDTNDKSKSSSAEASRQDISFVAVQGGIYKTKENADSEKDLLTQYGTPFGINEGDKVRIFLGIYTKERGEDIIKSLTEQKVDNSKMLFKVKKNDLCDSEILEIINANLQILNKLAEKNVKAIQTEELKKWCLSLKKVDKESKNILILNNIKDHVNKLPKELTKENAGENYSYIYGVLKQMSFK